MQKVIFFLLLIFSIACSDKKVAQSPDRFLQKANELLKRTPIVDTHIDFPWFLVEHKLWYSKGYTDIILNNPDGDFDWQRAKKGGLYGAFMSIYIPAGFQSQPGRPREVADSLINMIHAITKAHPDKFAIPVHASDVEANFKKGIISLPMGMENGAPIAKIEDIAYFHQRGIRYVTLTHGKDNHICDSSYDTTHTNGGLSAFGRQVVKEMNRVGIMVDVSHLNDEAIADVMEVATKPLVATHSACRSFTPGFERNLTDAQIIAIAAKGGVVQVPFSSLFLSVEARTHWNGGVESDLEKQKLKVFSPEGMAFVRKYEAEHKVRLFLGIKEVVDEIDHIVRLAGINAAGFGSDFDGVGPTMSPELRDVSYFPALVAELLRRGYKDEDVQKICGGNLLRVWKGNE